MSAGRGEEARRILRVGALQGIAALALLVAQPFACFAPSARPWVRDHGVLSWFGLGAAPIVLAVASVATALRARLEDRTRRQTLCVVVAVLASVVAVVGLVFTTVFGLGLIVLSGVHWGAVDVR